MTQEPHAQSLSSPNQSTVSTQPCSAPSPPPPEQALGLLPAGLSDAATDTSVLAALSVHQQPAAPMKFPRLCCSQLLPSAHSSKPQNGTNPVWSNASLVSVFSFRGQKGKGTRWDIYEPVRLAALTRKCSQVSFLTGEGTEQVLGKGSRVCRGWAANHEASPQLSQAWWHHTELSQLKAWPQHWQATNLGGFELKRFGGASVAPSLSSVMASKHLSAGHKETGLNIALLVYFPHFLRGQAYCRIPPLVFGFECKVPHITENNMSRDCFVLWWEDGTVCVGLYLLTCPCFKPTCLNLFRIGKTLFASHLCAASLPCCSPAGKW